MQSCRLLQKSHGVRSIFTAGRRMCGQRFYTITPNLSAHFIWRAGAQHKMKHTLWVGIHYHCFIHCPQICLYIIGWASVNLPPNPPTEMHQECTFTSVCLRGSTILNLVCLIPFHLKVLSPVCVFSQIHSQDTKFPYGRDISSASPHYKLLHPWQLLTLPLYPPIIFL